MLRQQIIDYVNQKKWDKTDEVLLPLLEDKTQGLEAVLLYVSTLRLRNQGDVANHILEKASMKRYAVSVQIWSQFANLYENQMTSNQYLQMTSQ